MTIEGMTLRPILLPPAHVFTEQRESERLRLRTRTRAFFGLCPLEAMSVYAPSLLPSHSHADKQPSTNPDISNRSDVYCAELMKHHVI